MSSCGKFPSFVEFYPSLRICTRSCSYMIWPRRFACSRSVRSVHHIPVRVTVVCSRVLRETFLTQLRRRFARSASRWAAGRGGGSSSIDPGTECSELLRKKTILFDEGFVGLKQ
jgi:hypothetical protein